MEYVQEFIKVLCESEDLADYNKIRVFLDEDYNSAEHFTVSFNYFFSSPSRKWEQIFFLFEIYGSVDLRHRTGMC